MVATRTTAFTFGHFRSHYGIIGFSAIPATDVKTWVNKEILIVHVTRVYIARVIMPARS